MLKNLEVKIGANTSGFQRGLSQVLGGVNKLTSTIGAAAKAALALTGLTLSINVLGDSLKAFTALESNVQRVAGIFGESSKKIAYFAENIAGSLNMAESSAYEYAAVYGNLFKNITNGAEENSKVTINMLKASAVVASKTGRTMEDVMERIRSGLLGNTESIEDLGINVNVAMLEMTDAFKKISNGRSWEQLNFYEQQQIRTLAILEQAHKNFGDEVQNNSAFSLASLSSAFKDLTAYAGQFINEALQPIVKWLTEVVRWATAGLKSIAAMMGLKIETGITSALNTTGEQVNAQKDLTGEIEKTAKANKKLIAGFDELNVITAPKDDTHGSGGIGSSGGNEASVFDGLNDIDVTDGDKKLQEFATKLKKLEPFFKGVSKAIEDISNAVKNFYDKYLSKWLINIGKWIEDNPGSLEKLGYGLAILAGALALYKGLSWLGEITGLNKLLLNLGKWLFGTKEVTSAMKEKNRILKEQTDATQKETSTVSKLVPALGLAGGAIWVLKKGLDSLKFPDIKIPDVLKKPIPAPVMVPAIAPKINLSLFLSSRKIYTDKIPAPLMIPAIAPALNLISKFIPSIEEAKKKIFDFVTNSKANIKIFKENIKENINSASLYISQKIGECFKSGAHTIYNFVVSSSKTIVDWATNIGENTRKTLTYIGETIGSGLTSALSVVASFVKNSSKNIVSWGKNFITNIGETVKGAYKNFTSGVSAMWESFAGFMKGIGEKISNWWSGNKDWVVPVAGVTLAAAGVAAVILSGGTALAALPALAPAAAALPAFADGGVVRTPTTALIGEYAGAALNPEIVTPQNIMYNTVVEANAHMTTSIVLAIQRLEQTLKEKETTVELDGEIIGKASVNYIKSFEKRTGKPVI